MNPEEKLYQLIRSRHPIIVIKSHETGRVMKSIVDLVEADFNRIKAKSNRHQRRKLYSWSVTRGLWEIGTEVNDLYQEKVIEISEGSYYEPLPNPVAETVGVFQHIIDFDPPVEDPEGNKSGDAPALYVLKDVQSFFDQPDVVRSMRDAAEVLPKRYQTIIIIAPEFTPPMSAAKDIAVIDWPLPTTAELAEQVELFMSRQNVPDRLNGELENLIDGLRGLTLSEADQVIARAAVAHGVLDQKAIAFVIEAKKEAIRSSGALEYYDPVSLEDVGGLDKLKGWLGARKNAHSERARAFGLKAPRGVLLVGVPGCGKSLSAKMASAIFHAPLLRLDVGALFGGLVGQSEDQTRQALKVADAMGRCVLWIDEIEKVLGSSGAESDGGTSARVFGTILTWMEETEAPVLVFATANDIKGLKPELVRRFSEKFFVDLPAAGERAAILSIHLRKSGRDGADFDLDEIAQTTEGFTGSEIEELVQSGLWQAFEADRELTTQDMIDRAKETVPLSVTKADDIGKMRKWASVARYASSEQEKIGGSTPRGQVRERAGIAPEL